MTDSSLKKKIYKGMGATAGSEQRNTPADARHEENDEPVDIAPTEEDLMKEIEALRTEISQLKLDPKRIRLDEATFQENEDMVPTYTGLPNFLTLSAVLQLATPYLKAGTLTAFQQVLLTLMRIRLNVAIVYLGYQFGVHQSTVSRCLSTVINVLFQKFVPLAVFWPEADGIMKNMPIDFKRLYAKCVSIIDCFEVFVDRSSRLDNRALTYSNYKSHNTAKYLISVTPQGFFNFISFGWGGRTSDRLITERSGYLNNLLPGVQVLADRGFNVAELVAIHGASLPIPAFTRGKKQLSDQEVTSTRHLASVKIHVERVIGNVRRKYPILSSTVPVDFLRKDPTCDVSTLDKIVHICCGLTKICESIVSLE